MSQPLDTAGTWLVAPGWPCWVPPHLPDEVVSTVGLSGVTVLVTPERCIALPSHPAVVQASRFLLAVLGRLPCVTDHPDRQSRLEAVLIDEFAAVACSKPPRLPMPQSHALRRLAEAIVREPGHRRPLNALCRDAGLSRRTFVRRFKAETGLTFTEWRSRVRMTRAIALLECGSSVTETSFAAGYTSPTAFSRVFRPATGVPPRSRQPRRDAPRSRSGPL